MRKKGTQKERGNCLACGKEIGRYSKLCRSCTVERMRKRHWRKRESIEKSSSCPTSPTGAHWWIIDEVMTCKFCGRKEKVKWEDFPKTF